MQEFLEIKGKKYPFSFSIAVMFRYGKFMKFKKLSEIITHIQAIASDADSIENIEGIADLLFFVIDDNFLKMGIENDLSKDTFIEIMFTDGEVVKKAFEIISESFPKEKDGDDNLGELKKPVRKKKLTGTELKK